MVGKDVKLGKDVTIFNPELVNLYGCEIGDGCRIGTFVEIRRQVKIGRNVKIQAFAFIPEGVTIGDGCFIGPHVCFTNDRYPRSTGPEGRLLSAQEWEMEETHVGEGASIGANATILCGLRIGKGAMIGAGSVVTGDVPDFAVVAGVPAVVIGDMREKGALKP